MATPHEELNPPENTNPTSSSETEAPFIVVTQIVELLQPLSSIGRARVLATVSTWLNLPAIEASKSPQYASKVGAHVRTSSPETEYPFAGRVEISAKEFMLEKDPGTDAERMACLAYYLTHYRNTPNFKTDDIVKLNTEAAQRRFANPSQTAKNAFRDGFLVQGGIQGTRQLSAFGEQYVQALPDRNSAKQVRSRMSSRRSRSSGIRKNLDDVGSDVGTGENNEQQNRSAD